jgi:hypothetical protein
MPISKVATIGRVESWGEPETWPRRYARIYEWKRRVVPALRHSATSAARTRPQRPRMPCGAPTVAQKKAPQAA